MDKSRLFQVKFKALGTLNRLYTALNKTLNYSKKNESQSRKVMGNFTNNTAKGQSGQVGRALDC